MAITHQTCIVRLGFRHDVTQIVNTLTYVRVPLETMHATDRDDTEQLTRMDQISGARYLSLLRPDEHAGMSRACGAGGGHWNR